MNKTIFQFPTFFLILCLSIISLHSCNSGTEQQKETSEEAEDTTQTTTTEATPLFDGTTFTDWEGEKDFFRIEDAAIVAGSMEKDIPTNKFLCTEKTYENFELTLKVKFITQHNNGGIQIRTKRIPDHHEVIGYQVDVGYSGGEPVWASIYDESRRRKFIAEAPADRISSLLKEDDFNDYRIRCEGSHIQVWFNGEQVIDYTEEDDTIDRSGIICVQIHSGKPSEAWYKDIVIKEL